MNLINTCLKLITDVITKNWIKRAHKNTCLHAMALEHEVFNAYDHILTQIGDSCFFYCYVCLAE